MSHLRMRALVAFVSAFAVTTGTFAAAANHVANANANAIADVPQSTNGVHVQRRSAVDCSEYQHTFEMPFSSGAVVMDYVVSDDTFRARLTRQGTGWVGLAVPEDPNCMLCMKNSDAVIGVPGGSVLKYDLEAYKADGVVAMEASRQTLEETSVVEADGATVVTFAKKLREDGENSINVGPNTFLWAMGPEGVRGELAYHTLKGKFQLDLTPCDITTTSPEAESPAAVVPNTPVLDMTGATLDDGPVTSAAGTTATTRGILCGGIMAVCSLFLMYFM